MTNSVSIVQFVLAGRANASGTGTSSSRENHFCHTRSRVEMDLGPRGSRGLREPNP